MDQRMKDNEGVKWQMDNSFEEGKQQDRVRSERRYELRKAFLIWEITICLVLETNTLVTWRKELSHWKRPCMLGKIEGSRRRGRQRRWDGWMASPTLWTWVWTSSGNLWWTEKPGVLQSMGSQRVGQDWTTELNWVLKVEDKRIAKVPNS